MNLKQILLLITFLAFIQACKQEVASENSKEEKSAITESKNEQSEKLEKSARSFTFEEEESSEKLQIDEKSKIEALDEINPVEKKKEEKTIKSKKVNKQKAIPIKKEIEKKGKFYFPNETYDFGFIDMGENVSYEFVFRNTGSKAINISSVDASCGCTTPTFPFLPIEPGESGKIGVYFKSEGRLGGQTATITIYSDAEKAEKELYLKGVIRTELAKSTSDSTSVDTISN